jgi:hypothetical protein
MKKGFNNMTRLKKHDNARKNFRRRFQNVICLETQFRIRTDEDTLMDNPGVWKTDVIR